MFANASGDGLSALPGRRRTGGVESRRRERQTPVCRKRIHTYSLAALKYFDTETIYVRAHTSTEVGAVAVALHSSEPFARLNDVK